MSSSLSVGGPRSGGDHDALREVEDRVLWLSTAIVHHANRVRPNPSGLKVGGHQASSASMVSIMTALWFGHLRPEDRVSVKPHASPALHAINYLLGELDERYLTTLREFGGLQSYPSRMKDPDPVDYSTGSVGIGATAPIWGALSRRYAASLPRSRPGPAGRQYSLLGDAELDEGAVWEAVLDPGVAELGEIVWIVDLNRQSLDRVVPNVAAAKLQRHVHRGGLAGDDPEVRPTAAAVVRPPGRRACGRRIDRDVQPRVPAATPVQRQGTAAPPARRRIGRRADRRAGRTDRRTVLADAIANLGGHDLAALDDAFAAIDDTGPTVIFAYTIKGYSLAVKGHPQNHSALLSDAQLRELAARTGADPGPAVGVLPRRQPGPGTVRGHRAAAARRASPSNRHLFRMTLAGRLPG